MAVMCSFCLYQSTPGSPRPAWDSSSHCPEGAGLLGAACSWDSERVRAGRHPPCHRCVQVGVFMIVAICSFYPELWHSTTTQYYHPQVKVKVAQSCLTLCDPMNYIVHGILQDRILEWVAFHFSRGSSQPRDQTQVSHVAGGFFTS